MFQQNKRVKNGRDSCFLGEKVDLFLGFVLPVCPYPRYKPDPPYKCIRFHGHLMLVRGRNKSGGKARRNVLAKCGADWLKIGLTRKKKMTRTVVLSRLFPFPPSFSPLPAYYSNEFGSPRAQVGILSGATCMVDWGLG